MQSQGSTSSQPSFDSLSSSDSLLFSDSEQAEDDADVFLTDGSSSVIIGGIGRAAAKGDKNLESPRVSVDLRQLHGQRGRGRVCAELQGFVRPLLELLNGLKTGRFDRGLSSFQQSVAMDRIQRIVGVLQRPHSGEKYLNTLLQVEVMLKLWFPHIRAQPVSASSSITAFTARSLQDSSGSIPPHKHRDQLHIPVKKRRLSWTGTESPTPSPVLYKCPRLSSEERGELRGTEGRAPPSLDSEASQASPDVAGNSQRNQDTRRRDNGAEEVGTLSKYKAGHSSEPNLTWVHIAPILSPRKACPSHEGAVVAGSSESRPVAAAPHLSRRGSPATQDSSVSSTTPNRHPKAPKKPTRCQSQPAAGHQSESNETFRGQNQCHATPKPFPGGCSASSET
ncbi:hypothetical protein fugu_010215 [Takifugu bimaculatus]|uniref:Circadian associated repressor of transcription n=1 Tax=Takifugu bimaculatus TaxID=433685 RepID=A0A4Z2CEP4_9TELE|nr:hypothetical protein fugu_010215 [Takifugu bimaculatus]